MVAVFYLARKARLWLLALLSLAALTACEPVAGIGGGPSIDASRAVPVALLVPRSAASGAALSQSFENAARLAIADLGKVRVDLKVYDTGGTAGGASAAASRAVAEGNKIILGPLFADAAAAAGIAAAPAGVNVLSFSNNPAIAGGNVYILGSTFQNTADRLMGYAKRHGVADVMIVHAQSPAEQLGRDAIQRAIAANGLRLAGTASFPLNQQGLVAAAPTIASQVQAAGADAIFLTSGNDGALPLLAQLLPENGAGPSATRWIGLQRLDIPANALTLPGLQGAWFAVPDPQLTQQFNSRYASAYGGPPHPLAGLAYDGIAAIGALVAANGSDALTGRALTRSSGFAGVNGVFRLRPNGTNERGLAVAEVRNNQVVYLESAPRSFGGFGF